MFFYNCVQKSAQISIIISQNINSALSQLEKSVGHNLYVHREELSVLRAEVNSR